MKIKIGEWYLNDSNIEDPHLVDRIEDATVKNQLKELDEILK